MTYTWITPKTDWTYRDKFTYTDYNRIRNNILYINEKINELFPELYMELDLGEPKTSYYDEYFPSEFNKFEDAIISFERTGVNYNIGERYYHYDNDPFVWEDVLNRLETCLLRWKKIDKIAVQSIYLRPHGDEHTLMYIGDSALFDVVIEPSNATKKNAWVLDNDSDMYVSKYLTCEKISDTQVRVTYTKGRGENAYNSGSDADKMFMVEDKNSLTDTSGYRCSESIYTNYIRVKVEKLKAKCPCHYLAQGSYINRKEENGKNTRQYYKFTKIADNVDGRGVTTLQMTLTDLYSPAVFGGNIWDANELWRKAIEGISFWAFSKDLRDVMQSVSKQVMSNAISKTNYSSKFHLPSFYEYGSQNANVLDLGSPYPYLSNNEITYNGKAIGLVHDNYAKCYNIATRSWYVEDKSLNSNGTPHGNGTQKGVLSSRSSYLETFNPPIATGIFPLIFIPSDLKVVAYMDCYKIDWSGESSLNLADIPLGSVVFDADGNKGDYSSYVHAQSITLSKTSISMKETAVQTLDISSILPQNSTYGTYLNIYTDIPDCISLNYTTDGGMRKITVTGLKEGTGHIYVELDQFPNEPVIAVCNVNILYNHIAVDNIVINEPTNPIDIWTKTNYTPETVQLSYTISPSNAKNKEVVWSSSNPSVATVDQTGKVTRVGHGTCVISVTAKDNNKSASRTVNVYYGVDSISLNPNTWVNPNVGATKALEVVVVPSFATGYTQAWSSSNTSIVTVVSGIMTYKSNGNATVTLTITEPHFNNNQLTATCEVSKVAVTGVEINEATDPIVIWTKTTFTPETVQLTATVSPSDAGNKKVTWSSSDTNVATVNSSGLVTRVGHGTCTITVTTEDGGKTDSREVEVNYGITSLTIKPQRWRGAKAGQTKQLNLIVNPSYASDDYTLAWSSQNTSKATVSQTGLVTIVSVGDTLILATATEPHFNNNTVIGSMHILESVDMTCGIKIDFNKKDPYEAVTYIGDIADYTPATVTSEGDLNYGDWSQDEFFMPRPCMLKFDGTVDYYLDPDNYAKKEDGVTDSDICNGSFITSNTSKYIGNAMMEWGRDGRRILIKATIDENDDKIIYVNITNKEQSGYKAYPFYKDENNIVDHFYTSIYYEFYDDSSNKGHTDINEARSIYKESVSSPFYRVSGTVNRGGSYLNNGLKAIENLGEGWGFSTFTDLIWIYFIACLMEKNISPLMFKRYINLSSIASIVNEGGLFKNKLFGMACDSDTFTLLQGISCNAYRVYAKLTPPYNLSPSEPEGDLIYTVSAVDNGVEKDTNFIDVINSIPCLPMFNEDAVTEIESSNKYQSANYANYKLRDSFDVKTKLFVDSKYWKKGDSSTYKTRLTYRGTPVGVYVESVTIPSSASRTTSSATRITATYEPANAYAGDIFIYGSPDDFRASFVSKVGNRITYDISAIKKGTYTVYVFVGGKRSNAMRFIEKY